MDLCTWRQKAHVYDACMILGYDSIIAVYVYLQWFSRHIFQSQSGAGGSQRWINRVSLDFLTLVALGKPYHLQCSWHLHSQQAAAYCGILASIKCVCIGEDDVSFLNLHTLKRYICNESRGGRKSSLKEAMETMEITTVPTAATKEQSDIHCMIRRKQAKSAPSSTASSSGSSSSCIIGKVKG